MATTDILANGPSPEQASAWAALAYENLRQEFPHATQHVVKGPEDPSRPSALHPSFHGSFDWHSAVHMHWLLVSLMAGDEKLATPERLELLDANLSATALAAEAEYIRTDPAFERPYGWAWLLILHARCHVLASDPAASERLRSRAAAWADALAQTTDVLAEAIGTWARTSAGPIRYGVHQNSAFALSLILEAGAQLGRPELAELARNAAADWFTDDGDAPVHWEPSGQDFLSPALSEADVMGRVLDGEAFAAWLGGFLPSIAAGELGWLSPPVVRDAADGHQGHLYGLGFTRSWQLTRLAEVCPPESAPALRAAAKENLDFGLAALDNGGNFMHDHWLASFAYLALARPF
jgi:hypothetical protein